MQPATLARYLHEQIPLTAALGVEVIEANPTRVELGAPLEPNRNHSNTVFGGSAASLATLACWALIVVRLDDEEIAGRPVIRRARIDYTSPIDDGFRALAEFSDDALWQRLRRALRQRGKGRITLESRLVCRAATVATFAGQFAVLAPRGA